MSAGKARLNFKAPQLTVRKTPVGSASAPDASPAHDSGRGSEPPKTSADPWTDSGAWVFRQGPAGQGGKISDTGVKVSGERRTTAGPGGATPVQLIDSKIKLENLKVIRLLGKGSAGQVNLAKDVHTKEQYAVKTVSFGGRQSQKMWEEETKRLWEKNPYLVQTIQAFTIKEERTLVLIQEYMDIGSLQGMLSLCRDNGIKIPEPVISVVTRQILNGLLYLHNKQSQNTASRAQMHRDLKPGNVLLNSKGECKVADFGTTAEVATLGQSSFIGTTLYMSPERIKGGRYSTPADLWAAGMTVAEMVLGRYPFNESLNFLQLLQEITSVRSLNLPEASEELVSFAHALMKHDPGQRPTAQDALNLPFITIHNDVPMSELSSWLEKNIKPLQKDDNPPVQG